MYFYKLLKDSSVEVNSNASRTIRLVQTQKRVKVVNIKIIIINSFGLVY